MAPVVRCDVRQLRIYAVSHLKSVLLKTFFTNLVAASLTAHYGAAQGSALELSASLKNAESEIELVWLNTSGSPCLLNLGTIFGTEPLYRLMVSVSGEGANDGSASIGRRGAIEGRPDPWVVFMPTRAAYSIIIPTSSILVGRFRKPLSSLKGRWSLTIRYRGERAVDFAPGQGRVPYSLSRSGPTSIPFCEGEATGRVEHR